MTLLGPRSITFEEAVERTETCSRHLLLGNGFSINAFPSFMYRSLFESARPFSPGVAEIFDRLKTEDFEQVLDVLIGLQRAEPDIELYRIQEKEVRDRFLYALSAVHPDSSGSLSMEQVDRCSAFLENFVGLKRPLKLRGRIYTTNYDLLLYWVIVRTKRKLWCYDSHEGQPYGIWDSKKDPKLVYLHGALHLYDTTSMGQIMLRYDGQRSLIEQMRKRLEEGRFPAIVAEGTSEGKVERIQKSKYLKRMSRHLMTGFKDPNAVLFTYGHSLSDRDAHLLSLVGEGQAGAVYVGAYGGLHGNQSKAIHDWAASWCKVRTGRGDIPPMVWVYDTATFSPWR